MASVVRDQRNGKWLARWRDPAGVQRKKSFARKAEADRFLVQIEASRLHGSYVDLNLGKLSLEDWSSQWLGSQAHLKVSTRTRYEGILRLHVLPRFGKVPLARITHAEVAGWVSSLTSAGLAPGSVRQIHRVLSLILELAVRDGRLAKNPAKGVALPRQRRSEPRFLTAVQVATLAQEAGASALVIKVLAMSGLRFGELSALRVDSIDLLKRRITVSAGVSEVSGRLEWSTPKSHQARSVPIAKSLLEDLSLLLAGKSRGDLAFTAPDGGVLRLGNFRRRVFDPAVARAGLRGLTPHDLRHTAASLAVAAGANVKAVQRMLGHASAAMTLDVYSGLFDDDLDAVADRMDALLPSEVPQMCHTASVSDLQNHRTIL